MAGRGGRRNPHPGREQLPLGPPPGPMLGGGPFGPGMLPPPFGHPGEMMLPPPGAMMEHKLVTQHGEIQRFLAENQRLAATHVGLRQELAAAQQELQHLQQVLSGAQAEKEHQMRAVSEQLAKMEAELRAAEPLKAELHRTQNDAQKLLAQREELNAQIHQMGQELHHVRADIHQLPAMKAEIDSLRQEVTRARSAFEMEKKANSELVEQRQAMEKNLHIMSREIEKLRMDLVNFEKNTQVGSYSAGSYGAMGTTNPSKAYGDKYPMPQVQAPVENGALPLGGGPVPAWGGYDMRAAGAHPRR